MRRLELGTKVAPYERQAGYQPVLYKQLVQDAFGGDRLFTLSLMFKKSAAVGDLTADWDVSALAPQPLDGRTHKALYTVSTLLVHQADTDLFTEGHIYLHCFNLPAPQSLSLTNVTSSVTAPTSMPVPYQTQFPAITQLAESGTNSFTHHSSSDAGASFVSVYPPPSEITYTCRSFGWPNTPLQTAAKIVRISVRLNIQLLD